jgi:hypothetical protein
MTGAIRHTPWISFPVLAYDEQANDEAKEEVG